MNDPRRFTGLNRAMNLSLPSNRYAVSAPLVVGLMSRMLGATRLEALGSAGLTFFTWSLARELDPDRPRTATLASAGVIALLSVSPGARGTAFASSAATGALMIVARAALNSTGRAARGVGGLERVGVAIP
jgi:hypothetical protein